MNDKIRQRIQSRLAFKPANDTEASRYVDFYKEDVPHLIGEARDLKHRLACWRTQGGDYVKEEEIEP